MNLASSNKFISLFPSEKRSGLKILVPSLIAYVVSKNGTELLDNFNLIRDYSVDGGKGFLVEYGKGMITTTEAPTTTENGTMTSNGGKGHKIDSQWFITSKLF